jgi:hypothetical protein
MADGGFFPLVRPLWNKATTPFKLVLVVLGLGISLGFYVAFEIAKDILKDRAEEAIGKWATISFANDHVRHALAATAYVAIKYPAYTMFGVFLVLIVMIVGFSAIQVHLAATLPVSTKPVPTPTASMSATSDEERPVGPQPYLPNIVPQNTRIVGATDDLGGNGSIEIDLLKGAPAFLARFSNEAVSTGKVSPAREVVGSVIYRDLNGKEIHRVNKAPWIGEKYNNTYLNVGDYRELVLVYSVVDESDEGSGETLFCALEDRRDSRTRSKWPEFLVIKESEIVTGVRLIVDGRAFGEWRYRIKLVPSPPTIQRLEGTWAL